MIFCARYKTRVPRKVGIVLTVTRTTDSAAWSKIQNVHKLLVGVITLRKHFLRQGHLNQFYISIIRLH